MHMLEMFARALFAQLEGIGRHSNTILALRPSCPEVGRNKYKTQLALRPHKLMYEARHHIKMRLIKLVAVLVLEV